MPDGPTWSDIFRILPQPLCLHSENFLFLNSGSSDRPCSEVGVPSFWKTFRIVPISESPGKSGAPVAISATTQPTLHMSTAEPYCSEPKRSSGARYHTVTTT